MLTRRVKAYSSFGSVV